MAQGMQPAQLLHLLQQQARQHMVQGMWLVLSPPLALLQTQQLMLQGVLLAQFLHLLQQQTRQHMAQGMWLVLSPPLALLQTKQRMAQGMQLGGWQVQPLL
jgi:hypothetical protein